MYIIGSALTGWHVDIVLESEDPPRFTVLNIHSLAVAKRA